MPDQGGGVTSDCFVSCVGSLRPLPSSPGPSWQGRAFHSPSRLSSVRVTADAEHQLAVQPSSPAAVGGEVRPPAQRTAQRGGCAQHPHSLKKQPTSNNQEKRASYQINGLQRAAEQRGRLRGGRWDTLSVQSGGCPGRDVRDSQPLSPGEPSALPPSETASSLTAEPFSVAA